MTQLQNRRVSAESSVAVAACAPRSQTVADLIKDLFSAVRRDAPESPWYSGVVR